MKALVYRGSGRREWAEVPDAALVDPTDAVVRITATTICGTDLHILRGDVPQVEPGRVLGHEAVGIVEQVGQAVTGLEPGHRVLVSCISACGRCRYCRASIYSQCLGGGGWMLGHRVDGTHAEYVRVPFADWSTHVLPDSVTDEDAVMMSDILPTAFETGVRNGAVQPGQAVVVVGPGPIGLAVITTARLFTPGLIIAVGRSSGRLAAAKRFGADIVLSAADDPVAAVAELTGGLGADVAVEAVGAPETFELCTRLVRPGGRVANIGVHGESAALHLQQLWARNITITTGLVDTSTTPALLAMSVAGRLDPSQFVTHRFALPEMEAAYDLFERAAETGALKVVLSR
ncbi:alcohol dehydrogenase catalytic domain-containing protein [Amycolatopsis rubida]|uniref:Alcohol dehydrogenase catalytic domain-containing protein n=1 Tax=Amycolatopsis rubida TaxID=112413 RepID=A0ABX0BTT3_9PSEU|nr:MULTISPECIES: alcohol dehydrogenase catalytic domain-containing protein [Amycolatopsis]MYW93796.1 alcohol dehydrogenase catalytic domain-containing protein [Amycolatopsis rubida]NEC58786.1 alcohol dehydrogenase catalytic domain-containing protein [Amycolatopsis rubida]OAP22985.1 putative zinc-type alcohol dehydrogenase-like protein YjmD [Amycolatopsis sp. M39]